MIIDLNNVDITTVRPPKIQAILICLFTDKYAAEEERPADIHEKRGWWGDALPIEINGKKETITWGSYMWFLERAKMSDERISQVADWVKTSLKPLIKAKIINEPQVFTSRHGDNLTLILQFEHDENLEIRGI